MHFGFALDLSDIDLWNIDMLDTYLFLLDTDIPSKYFACLQTSSRRLQDMSSRSPKDRQMLVEMLHKPIIRKFKRRKAHSSFICNVWGADLADMQLISKVNKGIRFLLCVIDIFSKYA